MEEYQGSVDHIIFRNAENGYTVAVFKTKQDETEVERTIVGTFLRLEEGDALEIQGIEKEHPVYGLQLEVKEYRPLRLEDERSILAYLKSGVLYGLGPKMGQRVFDRFGAESLNILDETPKRYLEVEGIGKKTLAKILLSYEEKKKQRDILVGLAKYELSHSLCMRIMQRYGENSLRMLEQEPYRLCREIKGMGFRKADEIAQKSGVAPDSDQRIEEACYYLLETAENRGDSYLLLEDLLHQLAELLLLEEGEALQEQVLQFTRNGHMVLDTRHEEWRCYLDDVFEAENAVASMLVNCLCEQSKQLSSEEAGQLICDMENRKGIALADKQKLAVEKALEEKILVLTGGPGTGKTTVLSFIISCFEQLEQKVLLSAPTGRAAKKMSDATGKPAKTIHRLLEVGVEDNDDRSYFHKNEEEPLEADVVIIDEMSMVDLFLFQALLKAMPKGCRLILVGDADQLPSVGLGTVLWDVLASDLFPSVCLDKIFRQAQQSDIIKNAHHINKGEALEPGSGDSDFFFMQRKNRDGLTDTLLDLISTRLPGYYHVDPKEIQVLVPMRKGDLGSRELNKRLQAVLNPKSPVKSELALTNRVFREGDKVMQISNNYQKKFIGPNFETGEGVYNGDTGVIEQIDIVAKELSVLFDDGRSCKYDFDEMDNLEHCYAMTVHKSQGSEFPVVILPVLAVPPIMQNRNILYTAVTRAKQVLVLIGDPYYVDKMIQGVNKGQRRSGLRDKLQLGKEALLEESDR